MSGTLKLTSIRLRRQGEDPSFADWKLPQSRDGNQLMVADQGLQAGMPVGTIASIANALLIPVWASQRGSEDCWLGTGFGHLLRIGQPTR